MTDLTDRFARERARPRTTSQSVEIDRIVSLPTIRPITEEERLAFSRAEIDGRMFEDGFTFFGVQAAAVMSYDLYGGLFAPIGVGWGKTLVTLMIAARAHRAGLAKSLLLVPPQVYAQLVRRDIPWARARVDLNIPFNLMGGKNRADRKAMARSKKKGCYILPHSCLSTPDSSELLEWIDADVVIVDEAHALKNRESARTKRLMNWISLREDAGRPIQLCALSGTITNKSIRDYHHLISIALREHSPLPLQGTMAFQWSLVLDAEADPSDAHLGAVTPLTQWARREFPAEPIPPHVPGFRAAYRLRLTSAPGVVATGDAEIGCSLTIANQPVEETETRPGWEALQKFIKDVDELWVTPSGDELDHAFQTWEYLVQLNGGFYYRLVWPTPEQIQKRRHCTPEEADEFLFLAKQHHIALNDYHKALRKWLRERFIPGLDTPMLVGAHFALHGAGKPGADLYELWKKAKDLEFPGMPKRDSIPVRVCDFKIKAVLDWALNVDGGALIWYDHDELGVWTTEVLKDAGIDALHCPAGDRFNVAITDPANWDKKIVATYNAHGTGKNLQAIQRQLFIQFPRQADLAEQVLGRTHRNGQMADELVAELMLTSEFDKINFGAALNDALYLHQTVGTRQKLIYANYDPLPRIYPSDFFRQRGLETRLLTPAEQRALAERFAPG